VFWEVKRSGEFRNELPEKVRGEDAVEWMALVNGEG
jgi:hypothetical protein